MIAVNGKGGTGKTTMAALLTAHLVSSGKGPVLAIDADPNSCFAAALGVRDPETIVGVCEEMSKEASRAPSGVTKDRLIEMRVQESLAESDGFDMLVMGAPEGPGCYCYVNNLLRGLIGRITASYEYVVIDNAAGMEHISRRTAGEIGRLVLVSDYSANGIRSAARIYGLARQMKIRLGSAWLVVNKVDGPIGALSDEIAGSGLEMAGVVPYSDDLADQSLSGEPVFGFKAPDIIANVGEIFEKIIGGADGAGARKRKI